MGQDIKIDDSTEAGMDGRLWQQNKDSTWSRVFCTVTQVDGCVLNIYESPDETTLTKSIPLKHASLIEVTISGPCPRGVARHSAGFVLAWGTSTSRDGSPRAVADIQANSVDSQMYSDRSARIILAAENITEHHSWLDILAPKCESRSFVSTPEGFQSFKPLIARSIQSSSSASTSSSSLLAVAAAAAAGGRRSGSRKSAMPYSFWASRIAI